MASAASDLRAENERIAREIHELLTRNTTLQREMMQLNTERDLLVARGHDKARALSHELQQVDDELSSLRNQCESMVEVISGRSDGSSNNVEDDEGPGIPPPPPRQRKLSTAIGNSLFRARTMSVPRPRRPSAVANIAKGLNKAASYVKAATPSPEQHTPLGSKPRLHRNSPQILSYAKGTSDLNKSLLVSTHSHYGNFRRHSGPYRKNKETIVL